jgi:Rrf2 family iron-sulfur cluster assembly transcriptional regulator
MRISTKARFAVTAMIDVAVREAAGPVRLTDIASRQHISLSYLEQLFSKLRQHGLVTSVHGPGGGYTIGNQIDGITVSDIIHAVEDEPSSLKLPDASTTQGMTQELWDSMNALALAFARTVTLKSLVLKQIETGVEVKKNPPPKRGIFKKPDAPFHYPNVPNSVFALGENLPALA